MSHISCVQQIESNQKLRCLMMESLKLNSSVMYVFAFVAQRGRTALTPVPAPSQIVRKRAERRGTWMLPRCMSRPCVIKTSAVCQS